MVQGKVRQCLGEVQIADRLGSNLKSILSLTLVDVKLVQSLGLS